MYPLNGVLFCFLICIGAIFAKPECLVGEIVFKSPFSRFLSSNSGLFGNVGLSVGNTPYKQSSSNYSNTSQKLPVIFYKFFKFFCFILSFFFIGMGIYVGVTFDSNGSRMFVVATRIALFVFCLFVAHLLIGLSLRQF